MLNVVLGFAFVGTLILAIVVYLRGQRARMCLASLISSMYLDQRQGKLFEEAYEAFCAKLPTDLDLSTRGAHCAGFIERYAWVVAYRAHGMFFLGMTKAAYESHCAASMEGDDN